MLVDCLLIFLPAYSPDLNPIEESFSSSTFFIPFPDLQFLIIIHSQRLDSSALVPDDEQ
jgi:transposase